jgi:hypothetical protein
VLDVVLQVEGGVLGLRQLDALLLLDAPEPGTPQTAARRGAQPAPISSSAAVVISWPPA